MIEIAVLKNVSFMLALTLCTLLLAAFFLKYIKKITPHYAKNIEVLEMVNLWDKKRVVLLKAHEVELLIGVSDDHIQTLHIFDKQNQLKSELNQVPKIREVKF